MEENKPVKCNKGEGGGRHDPQRSDTFHNDTQCNNKNTTLNINDTQQTGIIHSNKITTMSIKYFQNDDGQNNGNLNKNIQNNNTQNNDTQYNFTQNNGTQNDLDAQFWYAECRVLYCYYGCHYAECHLDKVSFS